MSAKKRLSAPLLYYGRIIGLFPFRLGEDQSDLEFSILGVVYSTVLAVAYSIVFVKSIYLRFTISLPMETPLIIIGGGIFIVAEYSVCTVTWLTFACRRVHIRKMLRDFSKIQKIAWEYFGIPTDYERIIHQLTIHATWINVIFLIIMTTKHAFFFSRAVPSFPIWALFSTFRVMHHNVILLFLVSTTAIGRKFRHLNEKLIERGRSVNSSTSINDFAHVHGLLCDLAESVSHFFSHLILLIVIHHFVLFVTRVYIGCMFLKNAEYTFTVLVSVYLQCIDVIICVLQEYFIGSIVDDTVKEARNTGNALHEMANTQRPLRQRKQVYAFSIQLLRRRLELTAYGFFKFDLTLIQKVISTAATYIIIMMQLENFNPNVPSALPKVNKYNQS